MTDAATYARGAELGFEGMDFYVAGRGGALGDVPGRRRRPPRSVFFAADAIRASVGRSAAGDARARVPPTEWLACGHVWAASTAPTDPTDARAAALLGRVVARRAGRRRTGVRGGAHARRARRCRRRSRCTG